MFNGSWGEIRCRVKTWEQSHLGCGAGQYTDVGALVLLKIESYYKLHTKGLHIIFNTYERVSCKGIAHPLHPNIVLHNM